MKRSAVRRRMTARLATFDRSAGGVFAPERARLDDKGHLQSSTGVVTSIDGGFSIGASGTPVFSLPQALTGSYFVLTDVTDGVLQSYRTGFVGGVAYTPNALRNRGGQQVWKHPAVVSQDRVRFIASAGFAGDLRGLQVFDMGAVLAMPCDITVVLGQSPATGGDVGPLSWSDDGWSDPRLLYSPGAANAAYGTTIGEVTAMVAPLQCAGMSGTAIDTGMIRSNVSPAIAFAKGILPFLAPNRSHLLLQAAVSGAGFAAADAPFNKDGSNPVAWTAFLAHLDALLPNLPPGSVVRRILWAGGEAETAADMAFFPAAFATFCANVTTALTTRGLASGQVPVIVINGPTDCAVLNRDKVWQAIRQMDRDSGHANSLPFVHVAETGPLGLADATHRSAHANREAGRVAAHIARLRGLL